LTYVPLYGKLKKKLESSKGRFPMPFRAIEVKHFANKGKIQKIKALFPHMRKTARKIASYQWYIFFKEGSFKRKATIKHIRSKLSCGFSHVRK
jgi:hypothetical protein